MSDLFSIVNARNQLNTHSSQHNQLLNTMAKTDKVIGAKAVVILSPNGTYRNEMVNTLVKQTAGNPAPVDTKYFFTVPPTILQEGDIITNYDTNWQWIVLNAKDTDQVVYHATCGKLFSFIFGEEVVNGFFTTQLTTTEDKTIIELPKGQGKIYIPKSEISTQLIKADAQFTFNGMGYKIVGRPNSHSSTGLIICDVIEYQTTPIEPLPDIPVENFELGWAKTFIAEESTTWTISTKLKYITNEETPTKLTITIPVQRNAVGQPIIISNHLRTYNLTVE